MTYSRITFGFLTLVALAVIVAGFSALFRSSRTDRNRELLRVAGVIGFFICFLGSSVERFVEAIRPTYLSWGMAFFGVLLAGALLRRGDRG